MSVHDKVMQLADKTLAEQQSRPRLCGANWSRLRYGIASKIALPPGEHVSDPDLVSFVLKVGADGLAFAGFRGIGRATAQRMYREALEVRP